VKYISHATARPYGKIELSSYWEIDKMENALQHIIPRQNKEYGLIEINFDFKSEAINKSYANTHLLCTAILN
jgi:ATP-dependent Lon protease